MYELLIVDDEIHIANGIMASIAWDKFGIVTVHIAHSSRQAMDIFKQHPIDIMICDIEMPEGDGFELLTWVRETYPSTQAVFLTCHAEFSYAQKAIQLGSLDYILKPVPQDVLGAILVKAIDKLQSERQLTEFNETYKHYAALWVAHQPLIIERFWLDLLNRRISSNSEQIMERIKADNIPIRETTRFSPIIISVQRWLKELTVREEQIMEYALRKAAEESLFINGRHGHVFSVNDGMLLTVIHTEGQEVDMEDLRASCEAYVAACNGYLYCHLSCYIGKHVPLHQMNDMYEQLMRLDEQNVTCHNRVFLYGEKQTEEKTEMTSPYEHRGVWLELLKRGDKEKLLQEILAKVESWKSLHGIDRRFLQEFHHSFLQTIREAMEQKGVNGYSLLSNFISPERNNSAARSLIGLQDWVTDIVCKVTDYLQSMEKSQTVADKIKAYIGQNLDKDFSRQDLADHLELSSDYVVKLFKKETGMSISDYIVMVRVNNAMDLLAKTNIPISEISLRVGYSNFSYFSKVFKNAFQMNPQEYRKKMQGTASRS